MPEDYFARIIGDKYEPGFYDYEIDDILAALDVKPQGASITADKDVRQQQVQEAQNLLMAVNPQEAQMNNPPYRVNKMAVIKMGLEQAEIKNIDELIMEAEPPPPPQQPQGQPPQGQQTAPEGAAAPGGVPKMAQQQGLGF